MSQPIPKWLVFVCATFILGACSSDTGVLGVDTAPGDALPVVAPSRAVAEAGNAKSHDNEAEAKGRGRYAMAAN